MGHKGSLAHQYRHKEGLHITVRAVSCCQLCQFAVSRSESPAPYSPGGAVAPSRSHCCNVRLLQDLKVAKLHHFLDLTSKPPASALAAMPQSRTYTFGEGPVPTAGSATVLLVGLEAVQLFHLGEQLMPHDHRAIS